MTLAVFFGCTFIAFGPAFGLFIFTIARDPLRIIILIAGSVSDGGSGAAVVWDQDRLREPCGRGRALGPAPVLLPERSWWGH